MKLLSKTHPQRFITGSKKYATVKENVIVASLVNVVTSLRLKRKISVSGELQSYNLVNMQETVTDEDVRSSFRQPQEFGQTRLDLLINETYSLPKKTQLLRREHFCDPGTHRSEGH